MLLLLTELLEPDSAILKAAAAFVACSISGLRELLSDTSLWKIKKVWVTSSTTPKGNKLKCLIIELKRIKVRKHIRFCD
jgi:hypothetical protein